jgi:hypothetical protein
MAEVTHVKRAQPAIEPAFNHRLLTKVKVDAAVVIDDFSNFIKLLPG